MFPIGHVLRLAILALSLAATTGCMPSAVILDEQDMSKLHSSQREQIDGIHDLSASLSSLERDVILNQNENTRILVKTIREEVEAVACPPIPQPSCSPVNNRPSEQGQQDASRNGSPTPEKQIVGSIERVYMPEPELVYEARIDSGAETSSLDSRNIVFFERNGEEWVRFSVPVPGTDGLKRLERPIDRMVRIIQSSQSSDEDYERRAVVNLKFQLGEEVRQAEFTLADRAHLTHRLLIGRNILRDVMIIDVGQEFVIALPEDIKRHTESKKDNAS